MEFDYELNEFWKEVRSGRLAKKVMESSRGQPATVPSIIFNIIRSIVALHPDREAVYGVFLDTKMKIISVEQLAIGSISGCDIYPREIIKRCIYLEAAGIILSHNHPSGNEDPTSIDREITKKLMFATKSINVQLYDHVIVGNTTFHSMNNEGDIAKWKEEVIDAMELH